MSSRKYYYIKEITDLETGELHERHFRRFGHEIIFSLLEEGKAMIFDYTDGSGYLRTSTVESIHTLEKEGILSVRTRNTLYTFSEKCLTSN